MHKYFRLISRSPFEAESATTADVAKGSGLPHNVAADLGGCDPSKVGHKQCPYQNVRIEFGRQTTIRYWVGMPGGTFAEIVIGNPTWHHALQPTIWQASLSPHRPELV